MKVGILSLQGAVEPHAQKLTALGVEPVRVKTPEALEGLAGLILPGGESTTMLHLLRLNHLWEPLRDFVGERPSWGVCAGAILLAKEVNSPSQPSLGAIDITVDRNSYGRQIHSFIGTLTPTAEFAAHPPVEGVFIRAPRFTRLGSGVRRLLKWKDEPVMVQQGFVLAAAFHPELTDSTDLHSYFLSHCRKG